MTAVLLWLQQLLGRSLPALAVAGAVALGVYLLGVLPTRHALRGVEPRRRRHRASSPARRRVPELRR
jgi:hypothetical protein